MNKGRCSECDVLVLESPEGFNVCPSCGLTDTVFNYDEYGVVTFAQLQSGYSRSNRFKTILFLLLGITFGPSADGVIWKKLKPCDSA